MRQVILKVDGRRAALPLFAVRETKTARDRYDRLWVKGNDEICGVTALWFNAKGSR